MERGSSIGCKCLHDVALHPIILPEIARKSGSVGVDIREVKASIAVGSYNGSRILQSPKGCEPSALPRRGFFYFFSVCVLSNGTAYLARNFSFLNLCTN
jgi:hypothetical protein